MRDLIDRQAVIETLDKFNVFGYVEEKWEKLMDALQALPSAELPDTNVGDIISRQAAIDAIDRFNVCGAVEEDWVTLRDALQALPTAERKGHWYKNSTLINCSVCKHCSWSVNAYEDLVKTFKYCPNCGARMERE